jgi:glycosidase
VDRFHPGDGREWLEPESLSGFYGGTLWGVRDKLDYIAELGITCIWLTPIFPSPSHHGYDATDYRSVEPRLGGEEALRALVDAAHKRGMRVLLDVACNHLSDQHPYFQNALNNPESPYRDWFFFDDSEIGYRGFFGVRSMPEINARNPDARAWLIDTGRYWLENFDVDGYRLDYAQGLGIDFWPEFRAACRAVKPDCLMFGEIVLAPDGQRTLAGRLDGVLDFHVEDALRKTYGWKVMSEAQYERFVARHLAYFPADFLMPSFIDNHDMDRFLFISNGDVESLKQAAAAQMRLPGPPIIYYGTEVGLTQKLNKEEGAGLEESRQPMLWGDAQNKDLLVYYRKLIAQRRSTLSR